MTAFVSDGFSYTPSTDLNTHGSWVQISGTINVSSDGGHATPRFFGPAINRYYNSAAVAPSADYAVRGVLNFDAASTGSSWGLTARNDPATNSRYEVLTSLNVSTNAHQFRRVVGGVSTTLGSTGSYFAPTGDNVIEFRVVTNGDQVDLEYWYGGVLAFSYSDTSADRILVAGYPGIATNGGTYHGVLFDDFEAEVIGAVAPTAPTGLSVPSGTITQTGATINWTDASADETGFKVEYSPSPYSSWTAAATTAADVETYALTGLTPGVTYKARVASTNANGDSEWVEVEFTTVALVKKLRVSNLHSDAIGATGVTGVVWAVASGQIVGAEIGEFAGGSIVSDGSGGAKLEINVTEFSGSALTTSDTPKVLIRGETGGVAHTTGIIDATVFEE